MRRALVRDRPRAAWPRSPPAAAAPDDSTPVACLEGAGAYLTAPRRRAGRSDAGRRDADQRVPRREPDRRRPGDASAKRWSRPRPSSTPKRAPSRAATANLRLGYLLGAAQRGADGTEGIHADLIRRLAVAARYAPATARSRRPSWRPTARASTPATPAAEKSTGLKPSI